MSAKKTLAVAGTILLFSFAWAWVRETASRTDRFTLCFWTSADCYDAAVASSPASRERGLQDVSDVPMASGMVFSFPRSGTYEFWMARTRLPLRAVWLSRNGTVLGTTAMTPCRTEPDDRGYRTCMRYPSPADTSYVLEIPLEAPAPLTGDRLRPTDVVKLVLHGAE